MASSRGNVQPDVEVAVLGSFLAKVAGAWEQAPTRQVARVGTILAGWPGEPVERDRIVTGVWGDKAPTTVTNTLQVHVSHLRRLIGKATIRSQGTHYILDVSPEAIDAEQFIEDIQEAARMRRREHYGRAAELLTHATRLWRGTPFPDIADPDLEARRARLSELRDQAREDLLECRLELAHDGYALADVVAEAKELISREPLREKGHVLLVRALAASDRPIQASAAYEAACALMRSTMGLDPGRALVDVHSRSLTNDDSLLPRAMRSITLLPPQRANTDEVSAVAACVREAVLDLTAKVVTVIEPDDQAARTLALAIAHGLDDDMPLGVIMVPAAEAHLPSISALIATATGAATNDELVDLEAVPGLSGLTIVVHGASPQVTALAAAFERWARQPVLITVGAERLDIDTEVVIAAGDVAGESSQPDPVLSRRGA